MSVLVIAEHDGSDLKQSTLSTITAASQLSDAITLLVAGNACLKVAEQALKIKEVNEVILADHQEYQHVLAESWAPLIFYYAPNYAYLLAPATTFGKNIMPRVAALLNVGQISDVIKIDDAVTYQRPIYAGNAITTVKSLDDKQVLTVRPTAFKAAELEDAVSGQKEIINSDYFIKNNQSAFVSKESHFSDRPDLATADIIISGGRGLQNSENFERLRAIADKIHAAVGATRAAVDAGFAPNDCQVGQTGHVVAPKLYIALGISGAIQHLAGMKDSQVIVAINKDADAPIFHCADYKLVADVTSVLAEWETLLE